MLPMVDGLGVPGHMETDPMLPAESSAAVADTEQLPPLLIRPGLPRWCLHWHLPSRLLGAAALLACAGAFAWCQAHRGQELVAGLAGAPDKSDLPEVINKAQTDAQMRQAQGICIDLDGMLLADGKKPAHMQALDNAGRCFENCRSDPDCSQATFADDSKSCHHSGSATKDVALFGSSYKSTYCGMLQKVMDMKKMREKVKEAAKDHKDSATCVGLEGIQIRGKAEDDLLSAVGNIKSSALCYELCRTSPSCGQASYTKSSKNCRLFKEAVAEVGHIGDDYESAYCGGEKVVGSLMKLRVEVKKDTQMRSAMGVCEELPGVQLADAGKPSQVILAAGPNATAAMCLEVCRKEPGCSQAIFSEGNKGCYLFKKASEKAVHVGKIYLSAYCGDVKDSKHLESKKDKILTQVQTRLGTGICKDLPGIQIADGSGAHDALFGNDTGTADKCIDACRRQLGCEQATFSQGNKGCYLFEKSSDVRATHEGGIFHSAYCGDLRDIKRLDGRAQKVRQQVTERKTHGRCFELPGIRVADGKYGRKATFEGNATREKCINACQTMIGCQQAVFSVKAPDCYVFDEAVPAVFGLMPETGAFHSAFCGLQKDGKKNKAMQEKVQKVVNERAKSGACVDLPGVRLYDPKGYNFYTWATNATDCVKQCKEKMFCGTIVYTNHSCHLFQNYTVAYAELGAKWHSARCSDWKNFAGVKKMQTQTLALMKAAAKKAKAAAAARKLGERSLRASPTIAAASFAPGSSARDGTTEELGHSN